MCRIVPPREISLNNSDHSIKKGIDTVYEKHNRKLQIAVSRNKALRTKKKLVQSQRGGSFWSAIAKVALPILGGIGGAFVGGPAGSAAGSAAGKLLASQIGTGKRKKK